MAVSTEGASERWEGAGEAVQAVLAASWRALMLAKTTATMSVLHRHSSTGEQAEAWGAGMRVARPDWGSPERTSAVALWEDRPPGQRRSSEGREVRRASTAGHLSDPTSAGGRVPSPSWLPRTDCCCSQRPSRSRVAAVIEGSAGP